MKKLALVGGKIITPFRIVNNGTIIIEDDKIYEIGKTNEIKFSDDTEVIDVSGNIVAPGFVDLLVHGGGGFGFSDENETSIQKISNYFLSLGSTTLMASLHAKPKQLLLKDLSRLANFIKSNPESNIKGIHMEGPYLNPEYKGAMNEDYLWSPSVETFKEMWDASEGYMKIMTIAPELPGALDVIREASFRGVICSIGHSTASYEDITKAISHGACHVTHMFNAMKPMHHRNPSIMTAALLHDELKIELIADTYHVHPAMMELLFKFKTPKNIILITDSIRAGGMHEGEYQFSDQKVYLKDDMATLADGTLAGSTLTLNKAIKNILDTTDIKITDAFRMSSLNGSKVIGAQKGILASGKVADIVVLNNLFDVEMTIMAGKIRYKRKV
ncbi:MAG: N-acetylglucosamine-6-phosphate deacetylase [bacterium]